MTGFSLAAVGIIASLLCNAPLPAVLCLSVAMFGSDMTVSCSWAFAIDIGGGHSGAVSGAMNMAGAFLGAAGTRFAGELFDRGQAKTVFVVFACSYGLAALCWLVIDVAKPLVPTK